MGTKRNPGQYDAYAKAGEDEPIFTLRAKDPLAPQIIRRWANLVEAEIAEETRPPFDIAKVAEARKTADDMELWRNGYESHQPNQVRDKQHARTSPGPVNCNIRLRFQSEPGTPIGRSCERCGIGRCPFFNDDGTAK